MRAELKNTDRSIDLLKARITAMEARQIVDARAASPPVSQGYNHGGSAAAFPYYEEELARVRRDMQKVEQHEMALERERAPLRARFPDISLLSRSDARALFFIDTKRKMVRQILNLLRDEVTDIQAKQTNAAKAGTLLLNNRGDSAATLSDPEVVQAPAPATQARHAPDVPLRYNYGVLPLELGVASNNSAEGVSAGHLPDSSVTAGAGPAPAAGTTAGQARVAVLEHAGLVEKKQRKRKRSNSEGDTSGKKEKRKKHSKRRACQHEADGEDAVLEADVGEGRAPDAATGLADHPKAEAAGEQAGDSVPAEPGIGQPANPDADQEATEADAMEGTPSGGACESGADTSDKKQGRKRKACRYEAEAGDMALGADLGGMRAPDAATGLADGSEAAAEPPAGSELSEHTGSPDAEPSRPPTEPGTSQPADPGNGQVPAEADASSGTPSVGALDSGAAAIGGLGTAVHCHAAEAITYADEEMPTGATADQAAATAAEDVLVGSDASPRPNAQPSKKKQRAAMRKKGSKRKACRHGATADGTSSGVALGELRASDATELADGPMAEAVAEHPETSVSAELDGPLAEQGTEQPVDPSVHQGATGTPGSDAGEAPTCHQVDPQDKAHVAADSTLVGSVGSPHPAKRAKRSNAGATDPTGCKETVGRNEASVGVAEADDIWSNSEPLASAGGQEAAEQSALKLHAHPLIQGCGRLGQAASTGKGAAGAAAQGATDKERLMAAQLAAMVKDAFKAGKAAVAQPATIRAAAQRLLPRRRQRQPAVKKVKRRPLAVTASAESAVKRVRSDSEIWEDPRYRAKRRMVYNQAVNTCSPFRFEVPTSWILPFTPSGKAVAQDAVASPETVRSNATQTTEHHMAALASDTGMAKADEQVKPGGSSLQAPAPAAELEASGVTPALRLEDEETQRCSLTAPTAPFGVQMPELATVSTEQPVQASLDALVRASGTASTANAAGDLAPSVGCQQQGKQAAGVTVAQASAAPKADNAEGQVKSGSQAAEAEPIEPICIDSNEDDHAAGSVPAGGDDVMGLTTASPGTRGSGCRSTAAIFKGVRCIFPPHGKVDAIEMTEHDLAMLDDGAMLNDSIIDFMIKWIREHLESEVQSTILTMNTFFFKKLTERSHPSTTPRSCAGAPESGASNPLTQEERDHLRVKSWTKGVDIFSKDYLLIPIHGGLHWSLIIVCHPGADLQGTHRRPVILHLDSMSGFPGGSPHDTSAVSQAVRSYLNLEWQRKLDEKVGVSTPTVWAKEHADMSHLFNAETIPHIVGDVPSQDNGYDCGLFLLTYMDLWTYSPPDHVDMCKEVRLKGDKPYATFLTKHWFERANASCLRGHIRNLILELARDQRRMPDDHPSMVAVTEALQAYQKQLGSKYCSPADHLAKLGVHKVKKVSSTSVAALDGVPTTSAVTGLPPSAEECLHTAMTPASLAPHISSASQGLGVCWQGKQSDVTVPAEQQQQASGGLVTGLESAGDAVHQPGTGRTLKREAMDGTAELMAGAPARLQRHLPPVTQHAQPDAHLTKRHKCIMPGHFTAVPEGAKGMTKADAAAAADDTPFQPAPSPQSASEVTAMSSGPADGAKAVGGPELLPGRKSLRKKAQSSAAPRAEKTQHQLNSGSQLGFAGLNNLGNTCYANSIVQCLVAIPQLVSHFVKLTASVDPGSRPSVSRAFGNLVQQMCTSHGPLNPSLFRQACGVCNKQWEDNKHHDAHDFLRSMLDYMQGEMNMVQGNPPVIEQEGEGSVSAQADEAREAPCSRSNSVIQDIFTGQCQSELQCCHCGGVSHTFDAFMDLSLPLPEKFNQGSTCTIQECLDQFTNTETLGEDGSYTCPACNSKGVRATKKLTLYRFPPVLVLHLKRFSFQKALGVGKKDNRQVDVVTDTLNLLPYSSAECNHQAHKPLYRLSAVVNHSGSMESGHYTAHCQSASTGTWFHCNDNTVSEAKYVGGASSKAYILLYSRQDQS